MNQGIQPGAHPDADLLSAFAEGALSDAERQQCMAHLSGCEHCRSVLYLAQPEAVVPELLPRPVTPRHNWFSWISAVGLAFACALVVMVVVHSRRAAAPVPREAATVAPGEQVIAAVPQPVEVAPVRGATTLATLKPPAQTSVKPKSSATTNANRAVLAPETISDLPVDGRNVVALGGLAEKKALPQPSAVNLGAARNAAPAPPQSFDQLSQLSSTQAAPPQSATQLTGQERYLRLQQSQQAAAAPQAELAGGYVAGSKLASGTGSGVAIDKRQVGLTIEPGHGPADGLAALTGVVTDPTGASIPGAHIAARQLDGAGNGQATSNGEGKFTLSPLPAGSYELTITSPGFAVESRRVQLGSRDLAVVQSHLSPGAATETVEVSSAATMLDTADAEIRSSLPLEEQPWTSAVVSQGRTLALGTSGKLYLSKDGKRWKAVKPKWHGKVTRLEATGGSASDAAGDDAGKVAKTAAGFVIITDAGEAWTSADGSHWQRR